MSFEKALPPPIPDCSKDLVALLKLQLTKAVIDGKANEAKTYLDVIERLAKLDWLDTLSPLQRFTMHQKERAEAADKLNAFITNWLKDNPDN
jgi:hypothetical protein